jgi:hypothetical protein
MDENLQMSRQGTAKLRIHDFTRPSASLYGTESGYDSESITRRVNRLNVRSNNDIYDPSFS